MQIIVKIVLTACICATVQASPTLSTKYFTQKVDHFNKTAETFQQRYIENRAVFEEGGPIILFVGGLETAITEFILGGPLLQVAVNHKGALISLEHRYFGESIPFNGNLTIENLQYLSVENALEDISYFIKYLNNSIPEYAKARVILAGSSYSGALVIWHRYNYRSLTRGAWSSSPMTLSKADIPEYKKGVKSLLTTDCMEDIHAGIETMLYELTWLNQSDRIDSNFRLCRPIDKNNKYDIMHFFHTISSMISDEVSKDYYEKNRMCGTIMSIDDKVLSLALALYPQIVNLQCLDASYDSALETYQDEFDTTNQRAQLYLQCHQLGWFKSGGLRLQPFGYLPTFEYFVNLCQSVFDENITAERLYQNSDYFNKKYDGLKPNAESVFMTYGGYDPENFLGPMVTFNAKSTVINIKDGGKSFEFYWWSRPITPDVNKAISAGVSAMSTYLK